MAILTKDLCVRVWQKLASLVLLIILSGCKSLTPQNTPAEAVQNIEPVYQVQVAPNKLSGNSQIQSTAPLSLFEGQKGIYALIDTKVNTDKVYILKGVTLHHDETFAQLDSSGNNTRPSIIENFALKPIKRVEYGQHLILEENNVVLNYSLNEDIHEFSWVDYTADIAKLKTAINEKNLTKIKALNIPTELIPSNILRILYDHIQTSNSVEDIKVYEQIMQILYTQNENAPEKPEALIEYLK